MSSNVVTSSNFNSQKISFSAMKSLDSGGKQAYVNYDGGMFVVQTTSCRLPFGMNCFDKAGPAKYSVDICLTGYDEAGSKTQQFYNVLQALDDFMIEQGVRNSKQWFKSELSRDVIKAFYTPVLKWSKDKDGNVKPYPPNVKLNLKKKRDSDAFDVQCYDDQRTLYRNISVEELLVRGTQMTSLIQCTGVWIAGSKYGLSWKLVQAMITELPQNSRNFTFVDEGESAPPRRAAPAPTRASSAPAQVADEDEAEAEEDAEEFVPPPRKAAATAPPPKQPVQQTLDDAEDEGAEPIPVPRTKKNLVPKKPAAHK
jgi:hypothetical protein